MRVYPVFAACFFFCYLPILAGEGSEVIKPLGGWQAVSPRPEIRPLFQYESSGGIGGTPVFIIRTDSREGLDGCWYRSFPVEPGSYYKFQGFYLTRGVTLPRRCVLAKLDWTGIDGNGVALSEPRVTGYLDSFTAMAETEFPKVTSTNSSGWAELGGTYRAPADATHMRVALHLQWARDAEVRFSGVTVQEVSPPSPRKARLATVHYRPKGGSNGLENCSQYAPYLAEAARQGASLVVLGETINYVGLGQMPHEVAEEIPGPCTEYLGSLAKEHKTHLVAGLFERSGHLVYNTAVLLGPDGSIIGKYRKTSLPRSEVTDGVCPGTEYPVFETAIGKIGMMICYDGFFPEVARELTKRGAEIIAWPVWGCNPLLARARACENHVYLISSTYEDVSRNWALSAVYDHTGDAIAHAKDWGSVAVVEVDLNQRALWPSLGDFKAQIQPHRPLVPQPEL